MPQFNLYVPAASLKEFDDPLVGIYLVRTTLPCLEIVQLFTFLSLPPSEMVIEVPARTLNEPDKFGKKTLIEVVKLFGVGDGNPKKGVSVGRMGVSVGSAVSVTAVMVGEEVGVSVTGTIVGVKLGASVGGTEVAVFSTGRLAGSAIKGDSVDKSCGGEAFVQEVNTNSEMVSKTGMLGANPFIANSFL